MFMLLDPRRDCFRSQINARKVGVPGKGLVLAAIDQKANLRNAGKVGVKRSDDRRAE